MPTDKDPNLFSFKADPANTKFLVRRKRKKRISYHKSLNEAVKQLRTGKLSKQPKQKGATHGRK